MKKLAGLMEPPSTTTTTLVEVTRGTVVESRHRGHVAVVNEEGTLVAYAGDPETITFFRSAAKPFQALPLVVSGAADAFGLTEEELAITCGSHTGTPEHAAVVGSILKKIGLKEEALRCGAHAPLTKVVPGQIASTRPLHHNCSGKHAGMLALALYLKVPTANYFQVDHPVQLFILETISRFSDIPAKKILTAIDGCGVPTYALSVREMALMYARLVSPPAPFGEETQSACHRLTQAMMEYPDMVAGPDCFDTELMRITRGFLVAKGGAEGVQAMGCLPGVTGTPGLGIALKIEDGQNNRARSPATLEVLHQLDLFADSNLEGLALFGSHKILNSCGQEVGEVRPAFQLKIA